MDVLEPTLDTIVRQDTTPDRILVIDQTPESTLRDALRARFPSVEHIFHEPPSLPGARNRALEETHTDVILYCDDDVRVSPSWTAHHLKEYQDPSVGGVVGRVTDTQCPASAPPGAPVGRFYCAGARVHRNFDATHAAEVDTLYGCNMSFRVEALRAVGGFSTLYAGTSHLEETDVSLRLKRAGHRLVFSPGASLRHLKLPSGGCRHTAKYEWIYWLARNHMLLHRRHFPAVTRPVLLTEKLCWLGVQCVKIRSLAPFIQGVRGLWAGIRLPCRDRIATG